jgi:enoyl-[acyl-carrier protein] reductase II
VDTGLFDRITEPGRRFLGVRYPFICGAMTWISDPNLVAAVSNAGGFASLAGGNVPVEELQSQIEETRHLTEEPFGVNLITIAPSYRSHLELVSRLKVPVVIFAGNFPRRAEVETAKAAGSKVLCFASTESIAKKMLAYGADGLILEGMEAGGHVGHVTLAVLLQQVLFEISGVPVFVAGGIATGRMCAHLFLMGAAGVQMGTRFAVAKESRAHPKLKKAFIRAQARYAVSTPQFDSRLPVVAVRALRNLATDDFKDLQIDLIRKMNKGEIGRDEAQEEVERFWMGRLRSAVVDGDTDHGSLMAGQSVGLVNCEMTVQEIIDGLVSETEKELRRVRTVLSDRRGGK